MISSEVQRTLVKSPPELWAELGDPDSLARHLEALGEVKITRTEPEELVEWEAPGLTGTVQIKASGWGTRVTISVAHEPSEEIQTTERGAPGQASPADESGPLAEVDAVADRVEDVADTEHPTLAGEPLRVEEEPSRSEFAPADEPVTAEEPAGSDREIPEVPSEPVPELEPRRGFFARLFGRRRRQTEAVTPVASQQPEPVSGQIHETEDDSSRSEPPLDVVEVPVESHPPAPPTAETGPSQDAPVEEPERVEEEPDLAAELMAAEESAEEQVRAALTAVLDRLGAAHHRPFSRA